jgi:hypothetical protein
MFFSWFKSETDESRGEKLLQTVKRGKAYEVEALILQGANIEFNDPENVSSLML